MNFILVNGKKELLAAKELKYAIPSANVFNLISIQAALEAAKETNNPLIVSLAEVHINSISIKECAKIVKMLAADMKQSIVLHFDHGFSKEKIFEAIDEGFTSVMIDGSSLEYSENVKLTKEIVAYAHSRGVTVEAEIGHVGGGESYIDPELDSTQLTTVEDAIRFANDTNVDTLAVSVGTAHGEYKGEPKIDFERLKNINDSVEIPLVLHGGSGSGDENLSKSTQFGICKINIFTDLANAARDNCKQDFENASFYDSCLNAKKGYKEKLLYYYDVFGTSKSNILVK